MRLLDLGSGSLPELVARRNDSRHCDGCVDRQTGLVSSELAVTEVSSALLRRERQGGPAPPNCAAAPRLVCGPTNSHVC